MSKNSTAANLWQKPPIDTELRVHLFNYTNAERYLKGLDKKLKVEDLGPYVYIEKLEKVNVTFNANHTISYRVSKHFKLMFFLVKHKNKLKEHRSYKFAPEKSKGHQYDKIMFPNIVLLTASSVLSRTSQFTQGMASFLLSEHKAFKVGVYFTKR